MISNEIKQKILKNVISLNKFGMNDLTWEKENAKSLITSIMEDSIGILGGNIYKIDSDNLIPMYDNWSCIPYEKEKKEDYYLRSKIKAFFVIKNITYSEHKRMVFLQQLWNKLLMDMLLKSIFYQGENFPDSFAQKTIR